MNGNRPQDERLLRRVDQLVHAGQPTGDPLLDGLAGAAPQPDPAFQRQLEERLITALAQRGETDMRYDAAQNPTPAAVPTLRSRLPLTLTAALLVFVIGGSLLVAMSLNRNGSNPAQLAAQGGETPTPIPSPTDTATPTPVVHVMILTPTIMPPAALPPIVSMTPRATPTMVPPTALPPYVSGILSSRQIVIVREGPGTSYNILFTIGPGAEVVVIGQNESGDWYNIRLNDGREGWITADVFQAESTTRTSIVIALHDITRGEHISADDVGLTLVRTDGVPQGALTNLDFAAGKIALTDIYAGQPILLHMLTDDAAVQQSMLRPGIPTDLQPVVVTSRDIPRGTVLRPGMLIVTYWPIGTIPPGSQANSSDLEGQIVVRDVPRWQPLLPDDFQMPLQAGKVAIALSVAVAQIPNNLEDGDSVDVVTGDQTIAQGARVLVTGTGGTNDVALVMLEVTPEEAQAIESLTSSGTRVQVQLSMPPVAPGKIAVTLFRDNLDIQGALGENIVVDLFNGDQMIAQGARILLVRQSTVTFEMTPDEAQTVRNQTAILRVVLSGTMSGVPVPDGKVAVAIPSGEPFVTVVSNEPLQVGDAVDLYVTLLFVNVDATHPALPEGIPATPDAVGSIPQPITQRVIASAEIIDLRNGVPVVAVTPQDAVILTWIVDSQTALTVVPAGTAPPADLPGLLPTPTSGSDGQ